jgi:hypothetical protein
MLDPGLSLYVFTLYGGWMHVPDLQLNINILSMQKNWTVKALVYVLEKEKNWCKLCFFLNLPPYYIGWAKRQHARFTAACFHSLREEIKQICLHFAVQFLSSFLVTHWVCSVSVHCCSDIQCSINLSNATVANTIMHHCRRSFDAKITTMIAKHTTPGPSFKQSFVPKSRLRWKN